MEYNGISYMQKYRPPLYKLCGEQLVFLLKRTKANDVGRCCGNSFVLMRGWQVRFLRVRFNKNNAAVAQLVEYLLAKQDVTGSNPVSRSKFRDTNSNV